MTAREVAGLLHAPVSTMEDWARRGILPSVKIGKRRLYIRQRIEAVLLSSSPPARRRLAQRRRLPRHDASRERSV